MNTQDKTARFPQGAELRCRLACREFDHLPRVNGFLLLLDEKMKKNKIRCLIWKTSTSTFKYCNGIWKNIFWSHSPGKSESGLSSTPSSPEAFTPWLSDVIDGPCGVQQGKGNSARWEPASCCLKNSIWFAI